MKRRQTPSFSFYNKFSSSACKRAHVVLYYKRREALKGKKYFIHGAGIRLSWLYVNLAYNAIIHKKVYNE